MNTVRVWFPQFRIESHRGGWNQARLVDALAKCGIECEYNLTKQCKLVFCGSFEIAAEIRQQCKESKLPVVHYNWDLYPFQIKRKHSVNYGGQWTDYLEDLKTCSKIVVPSQCTVNRTVQYTSRNDAIVIKSALKPFKHKIKDCGYVLNCMRDYPDPNKDVVEQACNSLGIPYKYSDKSLPWDEYKKGVAECRLLVSAQYEASTGGLSALEAYALGKPILYSDSERHGGRDYLGDRANYFKWNCVESLKQSLSEMYYNPQKLNQGDCFNWVSTEYSDKRFAKQLADVFRETVGQPINYLNQEEHIDAYQGIEQYEDENGYIVWRIGTGMNIELLHLNAVSLRKGYGTQLLSTMVNKLQEQRPYHAIFGFTRDTNLDAQAFYRAMGFELTAIKGIYRDSGAVLFQQEYSKLLERFQ